MPELPEVETVCNGLRNDILKVKIVSAKNNRPNLRIPFPRNLKSINDSQITSITRRAKYVLMGLDIGKTLIIHLGMSGKLTITKNYQPQKHDHMVIELSNGKTVVLNDARRFGLVALADSSKLENHKLFKHLGIEPLDKEFNTQYLFEKLKNRKIAIKLAIMDQKIVVGVGNIYACEALYAAKINPTRAANTIKNDELKKLVAAIKKILKQAIKAGGSSLRDYVQADGTLGYFQTMTKVYGREGEKCEKCNCKSGIKRITQGGRSTFYCAKKQK